jgi:hypothetical protein
MQAIYPIQNSKPDKKINRKLTISTQKKKEKQIMTNGRGSPIAIGDILEGNHTDLYQVVCLQR